MDLDPAVTRLFIINPPFSTCRVYRGELHQLARGNHTDILKLFNQAAEILLKFKRRPKYADSTAKKRDVSNHSEGGL